MSDKRVNVPETESLSAEVERLAVEIQLLRIVLDETRTDLQWAIQNGRLVIHVETSTPTTEQEPDSGPAAVDEETPIQQSPAPSTQSGTLF